MQRIFVRYFIVIMALTVGLTLLGNFALQTIFSQRKAEEKAAGMFTEISRRMESNEEVIQDLIVSLNDNYITRARALAEIIRQNPEILESFDEMERIAKVLNVDEVHVTDEKGILRWGNVKDYYGLDFADTEQTRPFLPALTDKSFVLAQEPQPNGIEGKLFQYISIARQDLAGIVQVGVAPEILEHALANNKIDALISNFNVSEGIQVLAIDMNSGLVAGDTKNILLGNKYLEIGIEDVYYKQIKTSGWINQDGQTKYAVFGKINNYLIEVSFTKNQLFNERKNQNIAAAISSILLGFTIIVAIFILLKRKIIDDMFEVNQGLRNITDGNLTEVVKVDSTPEFILLSNGINDMVNSLKMQMNEIAKQAKELKESNENILASLKYAKKIQSNLLPSSKAFDENFSDYCILWEPRDDVGGDIYWMKSFGEGAVLCVCDCTGHGTPGALLTMLVVAALDASVNEQNCSDTANILWEVDQRLIRTLNVSDTARDSNSINDGADLAILYIRKDGQITLSSSKLYLFVCNGTSVENIRGQKISVGEGTIRNKTKIKTITIPASKKNSYYIVSDGLFEQIGGVSGIPFGYSRFKQLILEHYDKGQEEITDLIWKEFKMYMGDEMRRDDVTLVGFKL